MTVASAAATVDTDIANLIADVATLVAAINSSQATYQAAHPGRYQAALTTFAENIRAQICKDSLLSQILLNPPTGFVPPTLATMWASF